MLVKSKIKKTKSAEIWMDDNGVLNVKVLEGVEITYDEVKICFDIYSELGCGGGNKVLQYMDASVNASMTKEAREYVAEQGKHFFLASAVATNNLAVRLIANFISKFYKLGFPFKIFDSEEKAKEWLFSYKK